MDLNDLKFLAASSLLGGSVKLREIVTEGVVQVPTRRLDGPSRVEIIIAVRAAQSIWEEVLAQDKEN